MEEPGAADLSAAYAGGDALLASIYLTGTGTRDSIVLGSEIQKRRLLLTAIQAPRLLDVEY